MFEIPLGIATECRAVLPDAALYPFLELPAAGALSVFIKPEKMKKHPGGGGIKPVLKTRLTENRR